MMGVRFRNFILTAKSILEILAILLGAMWVCFNFVLIDSPSLQDSFQTKLSINIEDFKPEICVVSTNLELVNVGKTDFNIDSCRSVIWVFPIDSFIENNCFKFIEFINNHGSDFFTEHTEFDNINRTSLQALLLSHFSPGISNRTTMGVMLIPKEENLAVLSACIIYTHEKTNYFRKALHFFNQDSSLLAHETLVYDYKVKIIPDKNCP